ncbi:MAG: tetratricopeptide repeat protein, partial [Spirochaetota bacterium]
VLVPGHIFLAFDLGISADEARRQLPRPEDLIFEGDTAWVPLETTALNAGFLGAWQTGARQWREAQARDQAAFVTISESWEVFEPVGLLGQGQPVSLPAGELVFTLYREELTRFIDQSIFPMVAELESRARTATDPLPHRNRLAVLYARYGLYDRADVELDRIMDVRTDFVPALINKANVLMIREQTDDALELFERALGFEPDNPRVLLSIAQINHAKENYGTATTMLARARQIDPVLAARFSYIELRASSSTRASERADTTDLLLWEE